MPTCAICGVEFDHVTRCKTCGERFCADCGNADEKQCTYCLDDEIGHDDDDDDFNTNENWYEKQELVERFYEYDHFK